MIFQSRLALGFKYYKPFLLTAVIIGLWLITFMLQLNLDWIKEYLLMIIAISFLLDVVLIFKFQIKRKLEVSYAGDKYDIKITEGSNVIKYNSCAYAESWWSYNNLNPIEDKGLLDTIIPDGDYSSGESRSATGPNLGMVLFLKFVKEKEQPLYLMELLEGYQELPAQWNYKVMNEQIFEESKEVYQLDLLRSRVTQNKL